MSSTRTIRIASRKSQLALVQTHWVRDELQKKFLMSKFRICWLGSLQFGKPNKIRKKPLVIGRTE